MGLIFGIGINDANYVTRKVTKLNGSQKTLWECPIYSVWKSMLRRCYSSRWARLHPSYAGSSVCDEWLRFSVFAKWMCGQRFIGMDLEKDLINPGNRVYGPDSCVFVSGSINTFITEPKSRKGEWPTGVYFNAVKNKFIAQINNPFTKKRQALGAFGCPDLAHKAWRQAKHRFSCMYADMQSDPRIARALRTRYFPEKEII